MTEELPGEELRPDDAPDIDPGAPRADAGEGAPATGDVRVDDVLEGLSALDETEIDDHPAHYAAVHEALREALTSPQNDPLQDG